ncbi:MAG: SDR family oxidoreductase [Flavobacteriaceae bacterium]|nr:SDR family oxidoreductase [Flavobacteriaceae bacterium]
MILVTGGTGLVGSHLLYQLSLTEEKIKAIHRKKSDLNAVKHVFSCYNANFENLFNKIEWVEANICDLSSLEITFENIDYVYHCAALVSFNKKDYQNMRKINIEGTANIVNFALSAKVKKLCYVSSIATIEKNTTNKLIDEKNDWNNETNNYGYAITKYGAEMEVWRGAQEGLNVVIVNPGVILGSGFFNRGSGELFTKVYNGFKFYTEGITGFVGVKDVVKAMIFLMNSSINNERFILVSKNESFKNIFFKIATAFGKKRPNIKVTKTLSSIAWRLEWVKSLITGKPPIITKHSASASLNSYKYTSAKIKKNGFEFENLETTIKDVCSDYTKLNK